MAERVKEVLVKTVTAFDYARQTKRSMRDTIVAYILSLYETSLGTKDTFTFIDPRLGNEVNISNGKIVSGRWEYSIEKYLQDLIGAELKLGDVEKFLKDIEKYSNVTPEMVDKKLEILRKIRGTNVPRKRIAKYFVKPELLEEPKIG